MYNSAELNTFLNFFFPQLGDPITIQISILTTLQPTKVSGNKRFEGYRLKRSYVYSETSMLRSLVGNKKNISLNI